MNVSETKEKFIVEVFVISSVFLHVVFAWQAMAEGDQSPSAARTRSLSVSEHVGQWLLFQSFG